MPGNINRQLRDRGEEAKEVNLHLMYSDTSVQHFCMFCRTGLFKSQYRVITIIEGGVGWELPYLTVPISLQCKTCGSKFHIQTLTQ